MLSAPKDYKKYALAVFVAAILLAGSVAQGSDTNGYVETNASLGSITVCKIIINPDGEIVDGSAIAGSKFSIAGIIPAQTSEAPAVGKIGNTTFTTPLSLDSDILGPDGVNDSKCVNYAGLAFGSYYYGEEIIVPQTKWAQPKYNDQYTVSVKNLSTFYYYDPILFDGNPANDELRNKNVDGHIVLGLSRPRRTLVVLNQYLPEQCAPSECNAKDGWYDNGERRWVQCGECTTCEEKEEDYRDYGCASNGTCDLRTIGYWKQPCIGHYHHETEASMASYLSLMHNRTDFFDGTATYSQMCSILNPAEPANMTERAKQQIMALWLNVVSGKVFPQTGVNATPYSGAANIAGALSEAESLVGSDPGRAKNIADTLNNDGPTIVFCNSGQTSCQYNVTSSRWTAAGSNYTIPCESKVKNLTINTCAGTGDLYLYNGSDPFQSPNTSFSVAGRDQLLIFTRGDYVSSISAKINGVIAVISTIANEISPFKVRIYSAGTPAGGNVSITAASSKGARGIQGYLAQDSSSPVFNASGFDILYGGEKKNTMYVTPGTYDYVFFDKYTLNNGGSPDTRNLTVTITGPSGVVANETYTQPTPYPTQGAVVGNFTATEEGYYNMTLSTEDSIYWSLLSCPKAEFCGDGEVQPPEECDDNGNNGIQCVPTYGGSCTYCTGTCEDNTLYGPYCGDGIKQAPYEECDDGNSQDGDGCSARCSIEPMIIIADKIVCDNESDLPNWGKGGPGINSSTRSMFLGAHPGCRAENGWKFQWAYDGTPNPGDNTGEAGAGWHTFGPTDGGRANASIYNLSGTPRIWAREVLKDGYINFTYNQNGNNENNVSAEMYCHTDVLNYDNNDYIATPALGKTYYCIAFNAESGCKDNETPNTIKTYGLPFFTNGTSEWINGSTNITLNTTDGLTCPSNTATYYRVTLMEDKYCQSDDICQTASGNGSWNAYANPFSIPGESCHMIEFFANDTAGNTETVKKQCPFVDNSLPVVSAYTGEPKVACESGCDYWVRDHDTEITLRCYDKTPHPSGVSSIEYRWRLDGVWPESNPSGAWLQYNGPIIFEEDSMHDLEYRCIDNLGNLRVGPGKKYRVDSTPPVINKTIIGPRSGDCPPGSPNDTCYIDGVTSIDVSAYDPDPTGHGCNIGNVSCEWGYYLDGDAWHGWNNTFPIKFPEETRHDLVVRCTDALGNTAWDNETFYVDKTPPRTTKSYAGPIMYGNDSVPEWISTKTEILLSVEDAGPHKSGINETKYRISAVDDMYCRNQTICQSAQGSGAWNTYASNFTAGEESCHLIEYYSVDNVNKTETANKQCAYVDDTPPVPNKTVGEPADKIFAGSYNWTYYPYVNGRCWNGQNDSIDCWKVTVFTPISMSCEDPAPHPAGNETLCYKVDLDGADATGAYCEENMNEDGWCCGKASGTSFRFNEESEHNLKYYCSDALGNTGPVDDEKFKVEGTSFKIQLNKKWNLISVPYVMQNNSIDDVFKDIAGTVESVWNYYGETGTWSVYTPGPAPDTLHEMVPGSGYWVKSYNASTLVIGGSLFSPAMTPPDKNVVAGWNLIGYYGTDGEDEYNGPAGAGKRTYCALNSLVNSMSGYPLYAAVVTYWELDNPYPWKYLDYEDRMDPGAGYWLQMDRADIYAYSTACAF